MKRGVLQLALLLVLIGFISIWNGCSKQKTDLRQVYTTVVPGAASSEDLAARFKKAHATRDVDAAMRLFYWSSSGDAERQRFWWGLLSTMFKTPPDSIVVAPLQDGPAVGAHLTVLGGLIVTTNKTVYDLLIGKDENGFYIVPPSWPQGK
jgi:hypothetical protein